MPCSHLLFHLLRVLPSNCHNIGEIRFDGGVGSGDSIRLGRMESIGGGLYNTLSLFNHSCCPSFVRANVDGSAVVCVTVRDIQAGEEITENYGPDHVKDPIGDRRDILQRHYGFVCKCQACVEEW